MKTLLAFLSWVGVALVALLPIINPVSTAVLLLGISTHLSDEERNRQVTRACFFMVGILVVFLLGGHFIMVTFGISLPGIRIAGGLVICFLGFRMLFPDQASITGEGQKEAAAKKDISFSPLAMPSLAGPGAIAVVITMSSGVGGQHGMRRFEALAAVIVAILLAALISWVVLRGAHYLKRIMGVNGVDSLSRIMGFLLVCIGVQFAINGVRDLVRAGLG